MGECRLSRLAPGKKARVARIEAGPARGRLLEMGLVQGALVEFVRTAPLGDPIEVRVRRYHLSLRRAEAEAVVVSGMDVAGED
jgi:ferrous iron transport protein A